jgi:hypothetical protein
VQNPNDFDSVVANAKEDRVGPRKRRAEAGHQLLSGTARDGPLGNPPGNLIDLP